MVTVAQLIEKLSSLPQDHIVFMASDEAGNSIRAFSGDVSSGSYSGEPYNADFISKNDYEENYETSPEDYEGYEENGIILWP